MNRIPLPSIARPQPPSAIAASEVVDFRNYFKVENYGNGSAIYRPGDPADRIFLLRTGRVRLMRPVGHGAGDTPGNETSVHALLRPGDLFGEVLRPPDATMEEYAVANGEVEVWSIESRDLRALVEARPPLALEVIRGLTDRTRSLRRRVNALTFKEVPARLAETLLSLGETHGERCTHGGEIDLRGITQQDLADLVGASRSFVSTLINEMKRDGILGNVGRTLCLRNPKELRLIAAKDRV
jgi:CRP-like cAMP-binding protein